MRSITTILDQVKHVRIGPTDYELQRTTVRDRVVAGSWGECYEGSEDGRPLIRIPDFDTPATVETLMHEIDHAVNLLMCLDDTSKEEEFTSRGTRGRLIVLRDNPWLLDLLQVSLFPGATDG